MVGITIASMMASELIMIVVSPLPTAPWEGRMPGSQPVKASSESKPPQRTAKLLRSRIVNRETMSLRFFIGSSPCAGCFAYPMREHNLAQRRGTRYCTIGQLLPPATPRDHDGWEIGGEDGPGFQLRGHPAWS